MEERPAADQATADARAHNAAAGGTGVACIHRLHRTGSADPGTAGGARCLHRPVRWWAACATPSSLVPDRRHRAPCRRDPGPAGRWPSVAHLARLPRSIRCRGADLPPLRPGTARAVLLRPDGGWWHAADRHRAQPSGDPGAPRGRLAPGHDGRQYRRPDHPARRHRQRCAGRRGVAEGSGSGSRCGTSPRAAFAHPRRTPQHRAVHTGPRMSGGHPQPRYQFPARGRSPVLGGCWSRCWCCPTRGTAGR